MVILKNRKTGKEYPVTDEQWKAMGDAHRKPFVVVSEFKDRPVSLRIEAPKPRIPEVVERVNTEAREQASATKKKTGPADAPKSGN